MAEMVCKSTTVQFQSKGGTCCDVCDAGEAMPPARRDSVGLRPPECSSVVIVSARFGHMAAVFVSPGTYVKAECDRTRTTQCAPCQSGRYTATKNHLSSCHICTVCSASESCCTPPDLPNTHTDTHTLALAGNQPLILFFFSFVLQQFVTAQPNLVVSHTQRQFLFVCMCTCIHVSINILTTTY